MARQVLLEPLIGLGLTDELLDFIKQHLGPFHALGFMPYQQALRLAGEQLRSALAAGDARAHFAARAPLLLARPRGAGVLRPLGGSLEA